MGGQNNHLRDGVRKTNIIEDMWESKSNMLAREGFQNEKLRRTNLRQYKMKKREVPFHCNFCLWFLKSTERI